MLLSTVKCPIVLKKSLSSNFVHKKCFVQIINWLYFQNQFTSPVTITYHILSRLTYNEWVQFFVCFLTHFVHHYFTVRFCSRSVAICTNVLHKKIRASGLCKNRILRFCALHEEMFITCSWNVPVVHIMHILCTLTHKYILPYTSCYDYVLQQIISLHFPFL